MTAKTDVFAFGVVLAELVTGQRALIRDNREPTRMKSLITLVSQPVLGNRGEEMDELNVNRLILEI